MANRKLNRPSDQRQAMLRSQVTSLLWYGKIETTLARAKEISSLAERLITVAIRECDNTAADRDPDRDQRSAFPPGGPPPCHALSV